LAQDSTISSKIISFIRKKDYVFVRSLGRGACGQTILLRDEQVDVLLVCKKYAPSDESKRKVLFSGFIREIKLLFKLLHPNIVRIYNWHLEEDKCLGYIMMEYVEGKDLEDHVRESPEDLNELFLQCLDGFAYLERCGVLHRDIRTQNILVDRSGVLKIIDLGFGKKIQVASDFDKSISLNWWCELPDEFAKNRYDFCTEVYFVGKLFEKLINSSQLKHFKFNGELRRMCSQNPDARTPSFSAVLQTVRRDELQEIELDELKLETYRMFSAELYKHVEKIENGAKLDVDVLRIESQLQEAFKLFSLEVEVPDCASVIRCFISGGYFYKKRYFSVECVREFLTMFKSCTIEQKRIIVANIANKLEALPRYESEADEDVPF
jgi:serine/threonine-protein kinase